MELDSDRVQSWVLGFAASVLVYSTHVRQGA